MADHLRLVETFRPNVFECLCDSASSAGSKLKRIRKSVDRSLKFLDETISERENNEVLLWSAFTLYVSFLSMYAVIQCN